ncbi:hypothetical protein BDV93DRAFT_546937 [Ceratobasidium sp. AG-I]|nr:hypothetical protein BDV93DRAFT_546937 [Ceratobasidium sp. AG-I]
MGLLDSLSRLSLSTDDIFTAANRTIADVGPFTDAVLGSHAITDIIRDAEEAEQTLFTQRSVQTPGGVVGVGVGRAVDVRPVGVHKVGIAGLGLGAGAGGGAAKEVDIEVLLGAALRLVESYGSMPRAKGHIEQLHDRTAEVRSRISFLEDELEELKTTGSNLPAEPEQPSLRDEEKAVVTFEAQLAAARRKRDALRDQLQSKKRRNLGDPGHTISTPTAAARTRTRVGMGSKIANPFLARAAALSAPPPDPDATTTIADQISGTSESLVDERPPAWADDSILSVAKSSDGEGEAEEDEWGGEDDGAGVGGGAIPDVGAESVWEQEGPEDETVMLAIPPAVSFSPPPSPPKVVAAAVPLRSRASVIAAPAPAPTPVPVAAPAPAPVAPVASVAAKPAVEVKTAPSVAAVAKEVKATPEMEINTALIWSTVGKVIAPTSNYGDGSPAPNATQTISILQSLASQSYANAPSSPATASSLQNPAEPAPAQTILTAILLLYLLREGPSPLPAVRSALAEKEGESTAGLGIKALYACVAKKLLKIDRKGREATVRFE